jgi:hypothetical protein
MQAKYSEVLIQQSFIFLSGELKSKTITVQQLLYQKQELRHTGSCGGWGREVVERIMLRPPSFLGKAYRLSTEWKIRWSRQYYQLRNLISTVPYRKNHFQLNDRIPSTGSSLSISQ